MLIAEACVYYHGQGKTLYDVLEDIFNEYGFYEETVKSYTWDGKPGMERISRVMSMLRNNPPLQWLRLGCCRPMILKALKVPALYRAKRLKSICSA